VTTFAKIQALRLAYAKTGEILEQNPEDEDTWIKIYDILRNAMTISKNFEIGLEYFKNMNERYERLEARNNPTENFITSFETIDVNLRGGGLRRGQVGAFVAGSGVGKSIALSNVAAANVRRGKRILYISLELDEDTVSERLDAIFTGEPIELLSARKKLIFDELNKVVEDYEDKNLIIIKDFPAGTADVNTFRAYIAQLSFYGFKPDMVIVDYVGEMKNHPNLKTYESRERSIRELRALAKEEDVCVLTAMQLNRGHKDAEEGAPIDERYLADSFGQTRPLDACWSIGVSKIEHELGIGRIYAIKHRDGKSKFQFFIEFNKMNLQITEISRETYNTKRSLYKEKNIGDVVIDDIDSQRKKKKKKRTEEEDDDGDGVLESV
jgi:KaiC/GvpD/RAD55 family RecA-like ATPase